MYKSLKNTEKYFRMIWTLLKRMTVGNKWNDRWKFDSERIEITLENHSFREWMNEYLIDGKQIMRYYEIQSFGTFGKQTETGSNLSLGTLKPG